MYRQIVESAHEGIWLHDVTGHTIYANAQMADLLGYTVAEMYEERAREYRRYADTIRRAVLMSMAPAAPRYDEGGQDGQT